MDIGQPNSEMLSMTDLVKGAWFYIYDDFNRITSWNVTAGVDSELSLGWTHESYRNRRAHDATGTGSAPSMQPLRALVGSTQMDLRCCDKCLASRLYLAKTPSVHDRWSRSVDLMICKGVVNFVSVRAQTIHKNQ